MVADMNVTLSNVDTSRGTSDPPTPNLSSASPPKQQKGVSVKYAQDANKDWFVLRVTYNRIAKACELLCESKIEYYYPQHYVQKIVKGKKKRVLEPFLPNLIFVYSTLNSVYSFVKENPRNTFVNFYYNHFKEEGDKNPPLVVGYKEMINFIKVTSIDNEHVRIVNPEQCHYKSGELVRIVEGDFEGVVGRVARVAGQQRVVVEIKGVCAAVTAYIPSAFLIII